MVKFLEVAQFFQKLEETTSRLEMSQLLYELLSKADKEEIGKLVYLTMGELVPSFVGLEFGVSEKLALEALSKAWVLGQPKYRRSIKGLVMWEGLLWRS
jgi:DNA ligase N terminus.